jgi:hypothetical protein
MSKRKRKAGLRNRLVLLATGEIFSFPPVFYSASCYNDVQKRWAGIIEDVIANLNKNNIQIILKNYAPNVTEILTQSGVIDRWVKAGGANISIFKSDTKGTAQSIFSQVSATIWDMPAGGLVESIALGTPAFSIWHPDIIRCQPHAADVIQNMVDAGILNGDGSAMAKNIHACLSQPGWWTEPARKGVINEFMSRYLRLNKKWPKEWKTFLREVQ